MSDNNAVSAAEVIEQIKILPANERAQVARFVMEGSPTLRSISISSATDGLPVIHANGGTITSQLVHDIESLIS